MKLLFKNQILVPLEALVPGTENAWPTHLCFQDHSSLFFEALQHHMPKTLNVRLLYVALLYLRPHLHSTTSI